MNSIYLSAHSVYICQHSYRGLTRPQACCRDVIKPLSPYTYHLHLYGYDSWTVEYIQYIFVNTAAVDVKSTRQSNAAVTSLKPSTSWTYPHIRLCTHASSVCFHWSSNVIFLITFDEHGDNTLEFRIFRSRILQKHQPSTHILTFINTHMYHQRVILWQKNVMSLVTFDRHGN